MKLFYFGARYYDPEVGIWTSTDPAEQFFNSYSYVGGNPITFFDPNGLEAWEVTKEWDEEHIQGYYDYAKDYIANYDKKIDCADLALTVLINYASENGLPVDLKYYDKGWKSYSSSSDEFTSKDGFLKFITLNLGALNVIDNSSPISLSSAKSGDLIMSKWDASGGHTRVIYEISGNHVTWYQGNIPIVVPQRRSSLFSDITGVYGGKPRRWIFPKPKPYQGQLNLGYPTK